MPGVAPRRSFAPIIDLLRNDPVAKRGVGLTLTIILGLSIGTAARAAEAVRIGVLTDISGTLSDVQGMGSVEAAKIAVEEFGGSVLGKPIEILHQDHQNKTDIGTATARRWIDTQGVGLILDLGNSGVAIGVQTLVAGKPAISISTGAASADLSNIHCNPHSFQWGYDTYQMAKASTAELVKNGGATWFFITADYAFGAALEADARKTVGSLGAKVIGAVKHPISSMDFSSYLMQAQASKADVIGLASPVSDLQNLMKQGAEFNVFGGSQKVSGMALTLADVHSVGLSATKGTLLSSVYYWDADEGSREFAKKFSAKMGRPPSETQAMNYSATLNYLRSIQAARTDETEAVILQMRALPVNDVMTKDARIREDGRLMRDIWLVRVKEPAASKKPWDYFEVIRPIAAENAFRPAADSSCSLIKK